MLEASGIRPLPTSLPAVIPALPLLTFLTVLAGTDGTGDTQAAPLPGLILSLADPSPWLHALVPPRPAQPRAPCAPPRQRLPVPGLLHLLLPLSPRGWFWPCYSGRCCLCYVASPVPPVRVPSQPSPCSVPYCHVPPLRMPGQGHVRLGATCAYTSQGPGQASAAGAGGGRWPRVRPTLARRIAGDNSFSKRTQVHAPPS